MSITIIEVKNKLLEPKKAHQEDAGFDLCCSKRLELKPFEIVKAETGVKFSIPKGNVGFVLPRSSISLKGVLVHTGVIDCGYTKLFTNMKSEGTYRYIQNIIGWMGRPEVHEHIDEIDPIEWRPDGVNIGKIIKEEKWDRFEKNQKKNNSY